MEEQIKCPKCQSTQVSAHKKGWSLTTGFIGSGKVKITCLKCGHKFSPGRDYDSVQKQNEKVEKFKKDHPVIFRLIMVGLFILMVVIVFKACS